MTKNLSKTHKLYPLKSDMEFGYLYNEDPFFQWVYPEDLQKYIDQGWSCEGSTVSVRGQEMPTMKCYNHEDCWAFATVDGGRLYIENCDKELVHWAEKEVEELEKKDPFIDLASARAEKLKTRTADREEEVLKRFHAGEIVSASHVRWKIENAEPSSLFFHPFKGFEKVDSEPAPISWTVENLIPDKSIGAFYGERESLKSFLSLHIGMAVATGTEFGSRAVRQGSVLYFAPEGSTGLGVRRDAWLKQNDWAGKFVPFYTRGGSFSFTSREDRDYLADLLAFAGEFAPRLVIFDTLGQSLGDADENSASDINKIARFLNDLKLAYDCSFLWVDHSGHESKRARGSSAKGGALDFEYFVKRKGDQIEVTNTKMKDAPRVNPFTMETSECHGSLVLKLVEPKLSHADLLLKIVSESSDSCEESVRTLFYEQTSAKTSDAKQKAFQRSIEKLLNDGKVFRQQDGKWSKLVLETATGHTHPPL